MADFRPIAPSTQSSNASSSGLHSTSSASGTPSTSLSGGNNSSSGGGSGSGDGGARRRRITGQVSMLACNECRRARARCDGERPAPCSRCVARGLTCLYEPHTKTHKDDLLRQIMAMRAENAGLRDEHLGLKESTRDLEKTVQDQSIILEILTNNGHVEEVIRRLREGEGQDSIAEWLQGRPELKHHLASISGSQRHLIAVVERVEKMYSVSDVSSGMDDFHQWTQVTTSQILIRHLFELYFTWVHPIHMLFGETDFLNSYTNGDDMYCSAPLVNAICAMACNLLDSPAPGFDSRQTADRLNLRNGFMNEARNLVSPSGPVLMTSIQAFSVMYLVDLSAGKARNASAYLRCAADHLKLPKDARQHAEESLQLSAWGVHTLNTAWSGITYQKPFNPVSPRTEVFINVQLDKDATPAQWRYYRQQADEVNMPRRQSFAIVTAYEQAKLYRIVHDTINIYCGARGRVTAAAIIGCYKRFLDWKENLSDQVSHTDEESQPLPHVLSLHVQYHTALTQLLAPLAHCSYFSDHESSEIGKLLALHAQAGLEHVEQCERLYSCRYNMPLIAFCTVHLADALLQYSPDGLSSSSIISFCLEVLNQNRAGFQVCGPLQQVFWTTAQSRGIDLPEIVDEHFSAGDRYNVDDILDAFTRLSYAQPVDQIGQHIDENIGQQWAHEWEKIVDKSKPGKQLSTEKTMQITSLLND